MKLTDLSDLKGLAKDLKKQEKQAQQEAQQKHAPSVSSKAGSAASQRAVLPDGSNATVDDYFGRRDAFIEDKYDGQTTMSGPSMALDGKASKHLEIDLHIQCIDHPRDLPRSKYLEYQLRTFRSVMDESMTRKGRSIVFIHGVGDGILRHALIQELDEVYWQCRYQDAPFHKYGMGGAILVTIR